LIRQAICRGILEQLQPAQDEKKNRLIKALTTMLKILFPVSQDVERKVEYFFDLSIELANTMAQEKALFCGRMVTAGDSFDNSWMESFGPEENRVYMCAFPMFAVRFIEDGEETLSYLVKAQVEHEGSFRPA
jgi:hypothetical protein